MNRVQHLLTRRWPALRLSVSSSAQSCDVIFARAFCYAGHGELHGPGTERQRRPTAAAVKLWPTLNVLPPTLPHACVAPAFRGEAMSVPDGTGPKN